jgi:hypothetical protein
MSQGFCRLPTTTSIPFAFLSAYPYNTAMDQQDVHNDETSRQRKMTCAICGVAAATTRDHVPPKGIFAEPRPSDLVTVPACEACNADGSKYDETFRVHLSLQVGTETPATQRLRTNGATRTVASNRKLRRQVLESLEPTYLTTRGGIIIGKGYRGKWDSEAHDRVVERTTRGLYFHHFGEILGAKANVVVRWFAKLTPEMLEAASEYPQASIGGDALIYRYGRAVDGPLYSIWLFQFYGRHWAGVSTTPALRMLERTAVESAVSIR